MICATCGVGKITPKAGRGRYLPYRTLPAVELPESLALPSCQHCGELWLDARATQALEDALQARYSQALATWAVNAVELLTDRLPARELETLLGLSPGYVSKVRSGKARPNPALVMLLMLLSSRPKLLSTVRALWEEGLPRQGSRRHQQRRTRARSRKPR